MKKENLDKVNTKELNNVLSLSSRILKIFYIITIVGIIFIGTMLLKEWKIFNFIWKILVIISPVFIGLMIAWIFNPLVTIISNKGHIGRGFSTAIVYFIIVIAIALFIWALIPILFDQINDLTRAIPDIVKNGSVKLDELFISLSKIEGLDIQNIREEVFLSIEKFGKNLAVSIPDAFVNTVSSLFSGIGQMILSLLLGIYLLLNFDSANKHLFSLIPKKHSKEIKQLIGAVDIQLRRFIKGTLVSMSILILFNSVGFAIAGLRAPILFAIFCGITNIIPFIGPYIGGIPAIIVGFSQSTTIGILVLIVIVVSQLVEGNIIHPIIMSKAMKLHPVTIIISLLIFGALFGIWGMIIATPLMAVLKIIGKFFLKKLKLFDMEDYDLENEFEELKNRN